MDIAATGRALRAGQTTALALAHEALERVRQRDGALHAFILLTPDRAIAEAQRADAAFKAGQDLGPMHGIPYGLKDIYDTAGIATTCHSKLREEEVPAADCVVAERLTAGGAVLIGKLATHEFAIGGPSFDLPFPPARNPWDTARITGGSSSGSGAAIAAGMVRMALGSDTGGSIRGPAAYCGVVGIKPTYGRVSRRGIFPLSFTLDHAGPLARTVADAAAALQVMAGHDPHDPASADEPVDDYLAGLEGGVAGLRLGVPRGFFAGHAALAPDAAAAFDAALARLREAGATVEDVALPDYALFNACGRVILTAEAYAIHEADLRTRLADYGAITQQRLLLGAAITAADLVQAQRVRSELAAAVSGALGRYDALITPAALAEAPRFDAVPDPNRSAVSPIQTIPFNVTGHPAMTVPFGLSAGGMPLGLQVVGRPFDEAAVFRIGRAVEQGAGWDGTAGTPPAFR